MKRSGPCRVAISCVWNSALATRRRVLARRQGCCGAVSPATIAASTRPYRLLMPSPAASYPAPPQAVYQPAQHRIVAGVRWWNGEFERRREVPVALAKLCRDLVVGAD